jgi:predicted nucleic acid-binding protein
MMNPQLKEFRLCNDALLKLGQSDYLLVYTFQNASEFWNVSTRPFERNGHGRSDAVTQQALDEIEQRMRFLEDDRKVYFEWRRLTRLHRVRGVQVHDAKLAASMIVHGVRQILTFNTADFARFTEVEAVHPASLL